jgi:uncharacterized protein (TIGR00255 family)
MVQSMTGYGFSSKSSDNYKVNVELKSLNSKFLELNFKLPRPYLKYEHKLRASLTQELERGKVLILIDVEVLNPAKRKLNINRAIAKSYLEELNDLRLKLGIDKEIDLPFLLELPEVIPTDGAEEDPEEWGLMISAIEEASTQLKASRAEEGLALFEDLNVRVAAINHNLEKIEALSPQRIKQVRERLFRAMEEVREKLEFDTNRFEQELIFYLEKLDINEEIVRLRQHLSFFGQQQESPESNGKQLNFIAQEMGREINTIGSKANDAEIQRLVVGMKDELEKIKEQVLNIV